MATAGQAEAGESRRGGKGRLGRPVKGCGGWRRGAGREGEGAAESTESTLSTGRGAGGRGWEGGSHLRRNLHREEGGTPRRRSLGRSRAGQPGGGGRGPGATYSAGGEGPGTPQGSEGWRGTSGCVRDTAHAPAPREQASERVPVGFHFHEHRGICTSAHLNRQELPAS